MENVFYRQEILEHYKNPHNYGELENPDRVGTAENGFCGDRIRIELKLGKSDRVCVEEAKFRGVGCALSTASASILTDNLCGMKIAEILDFDEKDLLDLIGVQVTPARLKCVLLPLQALRKAINNGKPTGS